jgi:hypothetical protein
VITSPRPQLATEIRAGGAARLAMPTDRQRSLAAPGVLLLLLFFHFFRVIISSVKNILTSVAVAPGIFGVHHG